MSEVYETQPHPLDQRAVSYDFLFGGEIPQEITGEEICQANMSMAGLCRATARHAGQYSNVLKERLAELPSAIDAILDLHDTQAKEGDKKMLFAFTDTQHQQLVSGLVFDIFKQWEITRDKNDQGPLVSAVVDAKRWLVVETAAAVMSVANKHNGFDIQNNNGDGKALVKVISCWGPDFSQRWFNGDILSAWLTRQQVPAEEQAEWQKTFSPFVRKRFIASSILNPLAALERVKYHLEVTLSDESIAAYLGWSTELTAEIFSGTVRKQFALSNISDPLKACQAWVKGERHLGEWCDKALKMRLAQNGVAEQ